ncbi:MAG: tetratricopeptide repeat protein, partial [Phycisphaerales bacterium]|nr:tetratricopeptide repeat protein [Phycisphaerales bacterium]
SESDAHRMSGRYETAIDAYTLLLEQPEHAVAAAVGLATCHIETGQYDRAAESINRVRFQGESNAEWRIVQARLLMLNGEYQWAGVSLGFALLNDPDNLIAAFEQGRLLELLGRRDDAIQTYEPFDKLMLRRLPTNAPDLTAAAQGFLRYSVLTRHDNLSNRTTHALQEFLQPAYERLDRTYWPARIASADLLRSKFRSDQSADDYNAALQINDRLADAHVGLGLLALEKWDFEDAEKRLKRALECNPRSVPAHLLDAALRLTERRYQLAADAADRALKINPNDVAALGHAAAAAYCLSDDDAVERFRQRACNVNPTPAEFHRILGDVLGGLRQYAESEKQYQLAIQFDPTDPHPRAELGLMYMQWGDEQKARDALDAAWKLDEFDARTFNTLDLLENLSAFARHETDHFIIRFDAAKDAVIAPYLARYLESIHDELCADFAATLTHKTTIQILPTHRMFAVRITGKPWIHTVGACTGRVIAMDSPRRDPNLQGPYNIANVLRHEFTHTVTLAATQNRIAHWLTEGLAVLQEDRPRSFEWLGLLADAVRRNQLFTLESIDWGFIRPRRPNDRTLAYAQSEWMCEYIIERFGYDKLDAFMHAFVTRRPQHALLQEVLGIEQPQFDADFAAWARGQVESWGFNLTPPVDPEPLREKVTVDPEAPGPWADLAAAEFDAGNMERALDAARRALDLDENIAPALVTLGRNLLMIRDMHQRGADKRRIDDELKPAMKRLIELEPDDRIAPKALARIALDDRDFDAALGYYSHLNRVSPLDPDADKGLAGIYLDRKDYDHALPHLLALAATDDHDPEVPASIGMIFAKQDRLADARYWYTQSIYTDPFNAATHRELAAVLIRAGDEKTALQELDAICTLEPKDPAHFEQAARLAHRFGDVESARRYAARAVALNPNSLVKSLLE